MDLMYEDVGYELVCMFLLVWIRRVCRRRVRCLGCKPNIGYGVTANMAVFHTAAPGSTPGIRTFWQHRDCKLKY